MNNPIELLHERVVKADSKLYWSLEDNKVHVIGSLNRDGAWIWPHKAGYRNCNLYIRLMFRYLKILPYPCAACWKVVVDIPDIAMLYKMFGFMKDWKYEKCKLGIEPRHYVKRNYGAYFYHRMKRDGLRCLREFRETEIATSGNLKAFLKRGCTEYEIVFGPSDKWDDILTSKEIANQDELMSYIHMPQEPMEQEAYQHQIISKKWQTFAAELTHETVSYEED